MFPRAWEGRFDSVVWVSPRERRMPLIWGWRFEPLWATIRAAYCDDEGLTEEEALLTHRYKSGSGSGWTWASLLGAALALVGAPGHGAGPISDPDPYCLDVWSPDHGLPHASVTSIVQSRDGYLWVGTLNGLARFDGLRFTVFKTSEVAGLKSSRIRSLCEDHLDTLWIGTEGGGVAQFKAGVFTTYTTRDGLSSDTVGSMAEDADGCMWFGTTSGLTRWQDGKFSTYFRIDGLPDDQINAVCPSTTHTLLIATPKGICQCQNGAFSLYPPNARGPEREAFCLQRDKRGTLWFGVGTELRQVPSASSQPLKAVAGTWNGTVSVLAFSREGGLWMGTSGGAVYRISDHDSITLVAELEGHPVAALCEDQERNLWIGMSGGGLARLKPRVITAFETDDSQSWVRSIGESPAGQVWIAQENGRLQFAQSGRFLPAPSHSLPDHFLVASLCWTPDGTLWMSTVNDGLAELKVGGELAHYSQADGLSDNAIMVMSVARDGGLWLGTHNGGLNHFKDGQVRRYNTPWGFTGNFPTTLRETSQGTLWIGTSGDGLFRLDRGQFQAFTHETGLLDDYIRTLYLDAAGVLWIGSAKGLTRMQGANLTHYTTQHGLPDDMIAQFQEDASGRFWIGSSRGLFWLKKAELNALAEGRTRFVHPVLYGKSDGMPSAECAGGYQPASCKTSRGELWFTTARGLARINPTTAQWNPRPPPVVVEQVLADGLRLDPEGPSGGSRPGSRGSARHTLAPAAHSLPTFSVPPGKQRMEFIYTALSLVAAEKNRFKYQLEGFDSEWIEAGDSRSARYTRIPPGRYRFRVQASNNDGLWNEAGAAVAVVLLPQFWQTWWFRLALAGGMAGLVGAVYRARLVRYREIERLRIRIARDLHDEVGSSLWSISLLSQIIQKHESVGAEVKRELGEIHRIAQQTASSIRDIVWFINPEYDSAHDLVLRMRDFAGTLLSGLTCHFEAQPLSLSKSLPLDFRQNLFLLFKEVLTNAAKHAHATRVDICLTENQGWRLTIRDNGVGFVPERAGSGTGLKNVRQRAEKLGGTVRILSQPGAGTTVELWIPIP